MVEFRDEGDDGEVPDDLDALDDPARFRGYVDGLHDQARADRPRPAWRVPETHLWWVERDEYLGRLSIRHELTERLCEVNGHIGYVVRPSARRRGHATAMLAAALPRAAGLGIDPALVTCAPDNYASRTVIERNGGIPAGRSVERLRLWVPTGPVSTRRPRGRSPPPVTRPTRAADPGTDPRARASSSAQDHAASRAGEGPRTRCSRTTRLLSAAALVLFVPGCGASGERPGGTG